MLALRGPGQAVAAAEVEEFEGALGAAAGGDVAAWGGVSGATGRGFEVGGELHVGEVGGDDQTVVTYEGFSGCADALFAVRG